MIRKQTTQVTWLIVLPVVCSTLLAACRVAHGPFDSNPPSHRILVSLPVVGLITAPLLPVGMTWTALLPESGSPHAFEPSPSHGVLLDESPALVAVHPHLDGWAIGLSEGLVILLENDHDLRDHDHEEENGHIWMDPVHVRAILPGLGKALCDGIAETCLDMDVRTAQFSDSLAALDRELRQLFQGPDTAPLLTALPFVHPLLDRYDVAYAGPFQRVPGDMVPPSALAVLLGYAQDHGARALVSQRSMMSSVMDQISSDAGLNLVLLEPAGHGFDSYTEFIRHTAHELNAAR